MNKEMYPWNFYASGLLQRTLETCRYIAAAKPPITDSSQAGSIKIVGINEV